MQAFSLHCKAVMRLNMLSNPKSSEFLFFRLIVLSLLFIGLNQFSWATNTIANPATKAEQHSNKELAELLGWIESANNRCGGYYLEHPFLSEEYIKDAEKLKITSNQYTFAQHGISTLEGQVTINYGSRQIVANKAYLYRDRDANKLATVYLCEALRLREPNTLILAEKGHFDIKTKVNSLTGIIYRTTIDDGSLINVPNYSGSLKKASLKYLEELKKPHKIQHLSAWGIAKKYSQNKPHIYHFNDVSYTTCPPTHGVWKVKASHIKLNKETGRGEAYNARLLFKSIPIFYTPYMNFPINARRKTGFLWPTLGSLNRNNSYSGYYLGIPFYWNLAPNYDTTITLTYYSERGLQFADLFRYFTPSSIGNIRVSILPDDQYFPTFKEKQEQVYRATTNPYKQAELNQLSRANNTRSSLSWQHNTRFNEHWSANIDYNYVSDDYFLEDFSYHLTENTQNQLPQQGEINYASEHWNFTGRLQGYQTLHPIDIDSVFQNQYTRLPQLILNGDYPDQWHGIHYFANNEATHFDIRNTPGDYAKYPIGNRLNIQPGLELPLNWPFLYINPRAQIAFTQYDIGRVTNTMSKRQNRSISIFDVSSGLFLDREVSIFNNGFQHTLEPQIYYVYIPYRNQSQIPVFDTTVNTLTYDQLFAYNRFSDIDRINDANRISLGITSRLISQEEGIEKLRAALGEIVYFKNRSVTLCQSPTVCTDFPENSDNKRRFSPVSGLLNLTMTERWSLTADAIWDPLTRALANQTLALHYKRDKYRVMNLGFSYVRNGNPFGGIIVNSNASVPGINNQNNLKLTDISFSWPIFHDLGVVGRWSEDWNTLHFQNLFYGLQYDSCCWAAQFVAGRTFVGIEQNRPQYANQFYFQISLKGLGTFNPKGDPTAILRNNISGYDSRFGQDL